MTKYVRIENACNSNYKVKIKVQEKVYDQSLNWTGEWEDIAEPVVYLDYPTFMKEMIITHSRRLVIEENGTRV